MKSEMEIARAHDILVAVINGEIPVSISTETLAFACAACDALCWVLEHRPETCPSGFAANLKQIEAAADLAGYVLRRKDVGP